jgi:coproporphyrinogen III oxidase
MNDPKLSSNLNRRELLVAVAGLGALGTVRADDAPSSSAFKGNSIDNLDASQTVVAEQMLSFMDDLEQRFFAAARKFNGSDTVENRVFDYDNAHYEVQVVRGDVIEKGGLMKTYAKTAIKPYVPEPLWQRYIEIDLHPKTPLVGQLHATLTCSFQVSGKSIVAGYMDYTPAVWIDEDVAYIKSAVDQHFAAHDRDVDRERRMLQQKSHKDILRASCAGVAFFPPTLQLTSENLDFVAATHTTIFNAYTDVLERRRDQPYAAADLAAQEGMRRRWLEDHLFHDPVTRKMVPYEVWSFADQAPSIKF